MSDTTTRLIDIERDTRRIEGDARHAGTRITAVLGDTLTADRLADADLEALGVAWSTLCTLRTEARKLRRERSDLRAYGA